MKKPIVSCLDDGVVFFYFLREIRDCEDGCDCILRLLFPAAVPPVFLDGYAKCLSNGFRSGIRVVFIEDCKVNVFSKSSK